MKRRQFFSACLVLAAALHGCSTVESSSSVVNSLTKQLGVTPQQASAGVGSMLNYAQGRPPAGDFATVSKAMPGADTYMRTASDALGAAPIKDAAGLNSAFSRLGMSPDMVNKFYPIVSDYVGQQGGAAAKGLLAGVFK
jgi:hypothetical protein